MAQPNIVLITADGLRWDSLGCAGHPDVRTPNIDALAAHGVRFSNALSSYPQHLGGAHAFLTGAVPERFSPGEGLSAAPPSALTVPALLGKAGYETGAVGAVDLSGAEQAGSFGYVSATGCGGLEDAFVAWLAEEGQAAPNGADPAVPSPLDPVPFPLGEACHPTTWTGNQGVRFCQMAREPFFLWVSFPRPRWPLDTPINWKQMYRPSRLALPPGVEAALPAPRTNAPARATRGELSAPRLRKVLAAYYGAISHLDRQIGRILATLTARGRTNNLLIFTASYGAYLGEHGLMAGPAGPLYDALIRVPLIVSGLTGQRRGEVEPALVSLGDIAPTLLDILQLPSAIRTGGQSFHAQLRQPGVPHRKAVVFHGGAGETGLRTARYKWITAAEPSAELLYDLQGDPLEMHNLQGERPSLAIRKMLSAVL